MDNGDLILIFLDNLNSTIHSAMADLIVVIRIQSQPPSNPHVAPQVTPHVTPQVIRLLNMRKEGELNLIDMTQPDSPKSPAQQYRLTDAGKQILNSLKNKDAKNRNSTTGGREEMSVGGEDQLSGVKS
jgi:hypothetical protein